VALLFGKVSDWKECEARAQAYVQILAETQSVRLMVLETWFFVDFAIRELLMYGLQLDKIDNADLDLRYTLLPRPGTCSKNSRGEQAVEERT
jgi:hypothetical protein